MSARARSNLSLYSATSFANAAPSGGAGPASAAVATLLSLTAAAGALSPLGAAVESVMIPFPHRLPDDCPAYQCFAAKNQAWRLPALSRMPRRVGRDLGWGQQLADDLGRV